MDVGQGLGRRSDAPGPASFGIDRPPADDSASASGRPSAIRPRGACEVKAAETDADPEDFRGIQRLARRIGDQLAVGIVLYAGRQSPLPFGDRLHAWPISALWTLIPHVGGK